MALVITATCILIQIIVTFTNIVRKNPEFHVSHPISQLFNYTSNFLVNTEFLWVCFDEAFAAALLFANLRRLFGFSSDRRRVFT